MTDLLYSEVEEDLRRSVREMLADRSPVSQVLARCEQGEAYDAALWRVLAGQMGLAGLAVPETQGGAGASLREAAVVAEELGRAVAPVPFLGSAVVATTALRALGGAPGGDHADVEGLLARLASGATVAALAVPFATPPGGPASGPEAGVTADGSALSGQVRGVADALGADVLLVPAEPGLFLVTPDAAGLVRSPVVSLDLTRPLCDVTLDRTPGRLIVAGAGTGSGAAAAVRAALTAGAAVLASEQLGVAEWCLDTTVAYVTSRYQFGRPVGSFQALKHRLADIWVEITQARAAARYAVACLTDGGVDGDPDATLAASLAQAHCAAVAVHAAEECVQLHGGIGFTWEHPAHLFLKRARADAVAFGSPDQHRAALAALADLPAPMIASI